MKWKKHRHKWSKWVYLISYEGINTRERFCKTCRLVERKAIAPK